MAEIGAGEAIGRDVLDAREATKLHRPRQFFGEDLEGALRSLLSGGEDPVERRPARENRIRAKGDRLDDVRAASDAAVDHHAASAGDGGYNIRKEIQGRNTGVELPAAVVRDDDRVGTHPYSAFGIIRPDDALHDELAAPLIPDRLQPVQSNDGS